MRFRVCPDVNLWSRPLAVVIDHNLRPNSGEEAEQALEAAINLGLKPHYDKLNWGMGKPHKSKAMEEARRKRYAALYTSCIASGSQILITGHNAGTD